MTLHLNKLKCPSTKDASCQITLKLAHCFFLKEDFKFCQCIFSISWLSPLTKGWGPSPKDDLYQVWLKLAQCFGRGRKLLNYVNVFSLFLNYFPLEKGMVLHLNKLKSPSPKHTLYQIRLKLAQCFFLKEDFKIFSMYFLYFVIISPWKRVGSFTQGWFISSLVEIGWNWPTSSGEEDFKFCQCLFTVS